LSKKDELTIYLDEYISFGLDNFSNELEKIGPKPISEHHTFRVTKIVNLNWLKLK